MTVLTGRVIIERNDIVVLMRSAFGSDSAAVSSVIGTVLLVSIVTLTMAAIALVVAGVGVFATTPSVELVYDESEDGNNVSIGVKSISVDDLAQSEITLLRDGEDCGSWGSDGALSAGDTMILESANCSSGDNFENGDVIRVISSNTLLSDYVIHRQ